MSKDKMPDSAPTPGRKIVTGLSVLDTPGDRPGHISLQLAGGDGLDAMMNEVVSFRASRWKFDLDANHDLAIKNRKALVSRAPIRR
jgi:hypothetical protein